jgi:hypothetical protein
MTERARGLCSVARSLWRPMHHAWHARHDDAVPVQAQTPEIDALRARAEEGVTEAQIDLGSRTPTAKASRRMTSKRTCGSTSPPLSLLARTGTGG